MSNKRNYNTGLLLLRLTLGGLMLFHGIAKITHGVDGISGMLAGKGIPGFLAYGVFIGEIVAPALMIVGFRTRLAALVFAVNMLVAFVLAYPTDIFALGKSGGWALELIGLYFFGALALVLTGGGKFSISKSEWWD